MSSASRKNKHQSERGCYKHQKLYSVDELEPEDVEIRLRGHRGQKRLWRSTETTRSRRVGKKGRRLWAGGLHVGEFEKINGG